MKNTIRPSVAIAAGLCSLVAIGLLLKLFRSSNSNESSAAAPRSASHTRTLPAERKIRLNPHGGGWIAQESDERLDAAPDTGSSRSRVRARSRTGSAAGAEEAVSAAKAGSAASDAGGAAVVHGGARSSPGTAGAGETNQSASATGGTASTAGSEPIRADSTVPFQAPRVGVQGAGSLAGAGNPAPASEVPPAVAEHDTSPGNLAQPPGGTQLGAHDPSNNIPADQMAHFDAKNMVGSNTGAVSFWLEPKWEADNATNATLVQLGNSDTQVNGLEIYKDGQSLHLAFAGGSGDPIDIGTAIDGWQPSGEKHLVTATWGQPGADGQSLVSFYVDGKLAGQQSYSGEFEAGQNLPLNIGSAYGDAPAVPGVFSNFRIYTQALTSQQLGQMHVAGTTTK